MDKSLKSPYTPLFQAWLAAPLAWFAFLVIPYLFSGPKSMLLTAAFLVFFPLVCFLVFGTGEFRKYDRVTPRRLLIFAAGIFLFVAILITVFGLVDGSLRWTSDMIHYPLLWSLAITPAFTLKAIFFLPIRRRAC
ncbi:MAG: hypothetical protein JST51_05890 [Armatimonadetes bacterium]|nr:hypothetical protein [Armatimonadota bacterium]